MRLHWLAMVCVVAWSTSERAHAEAPSQSALMGKSTPKVAGDPEARQLYEQGQRSFDAGDYADAITKFRASYQRSGAPGLLYNLAQAHRLKGDCVQALALYRRFLATSPTGKSRERAEARIAEIQPCAGDQAARSPTADPAPDGTKAAPASTAPVANPPEFISVRDISHGKTPSAGHPRAPMALTIGGAVVTAAGAVAGLVAWRKVHGIEADAAAQRSQDETNFGFRNYEIAGYVLGGVGLAAVATGVVLSLGHASPEEGRVSIVLPQVGHHRASASVEFRF
jgi:hypothetical protein